MTGDQSVIKSRVAKGQKPFFQATCPQLTLLQNNVMCVGFVLLSMMLFPEKKITTKKLVSVLTGVDTPGKKRKKEKKGAGSGVGGGEESTQIRPRTKCQEEMRVGEAVEGEGGGERKQTRVKRTPASNSDLTVI